MVCERISESFDQHPQETDPRRSSALSRRTCPASPSTSFFPNASRNSRDLTSLAARVHTPTPNNISAKDSQTTDGSEGLDEDMKCSLVGEQRVVPDWQLPSLDFRPLSFLHCSQGAAERPRSSGPIMSSNPPSIMSPTPERPMSSQSRRRFSKILALDDGGCSPVHSPRNLSTSHTSLNAGKLKRVLENAETSYPKRYSIPPFSPRNSIIAESIRDNGSTRGSTDHEQESGCEKSTVESLLDKHIECLGLQSEDAVDYAEDPKAFGDNGTQASTVGTNMDESTVKITLDPAPKCRHRAQTISSVNVSTTASPVEQILVPRRLFSPDAPRRPRLTAAQSSPCVSNPSFPNASSRPSLGWKTLASTSRISSDDPTLSQCTISSPQPNDENASSDVEAKHLSMTRLSPTSSSCWSGDSEDLYNWNEDVSTKQRSRQPALERQLSQRRRMRMRLKLKRNSQSQGRICASELSSAHESFHTARALSRDQVSIVEPLSKQDLITFKNHNTFNVGSISEHMADNDPMQQTAKSNPPPISLGIPNRRSSVVAIATQRVKHSVDMARKMSVKTIRSHRSTASIVEPLNSSRMSAVAPHLASPDLGPPLTPMSLNLNFAFPPAAVAPPAGLRATQSFFSDDSSAVQNQRGSLRKRFNLPSLRSVLPSSPRAHSLVNAAERNSQAGHSKLHRSCQMQGLKQEDEEVDLYGTVGMSEFAYCRRKMLDRVKGWWRRQCVQRKFGLKRRRSELQPSQGH